MWSANSIFENLSSIVANWLCSSNSFTSGEMSRHEWYSHFNEASFFSFEFRSCRIESDERSDDQKRKCGNLPLLLIEFPLLTYNSYSLRRRNLSTHECGKGNSGIFCTNSSAIIMHRVFSGSKFLNIDLIKPEAIGAKECSDHTFWRRKRHLVWRDLGRSIRSSAILMLAFVIFGD